MNTQLWNISLFCDYVKWIDPIERNQNIRSNKGIKNGAKKNYNWWSKSSILEAPVDRNVLLKNTSGPITNAFIKSNCRCVFVSEQINRIKCHVGNCKNFDQTKIYHTVSDIYIIYISIALSMTLTYTFASIIFLWHGKKWGQQKFVKWQSILK